MEFRKQFKGTDLSKVTAKNKLATGWYCGTKFDGNYVQIIKDNGIVTMYTSSGHKYRIESLCEMLKRLPYNFHIEAEFNGKGSTGLELFDRIHSATTSHVSKYSKGITSDDRESKLKIFDIFSYDDYDLLNYKFEVRLMYLEKLQDLLLDCCISEDRIRCVEWTYVDTLDEAIELSKHIINNGSEGLFCFNKNHMIKDKGRSQLAIKIKEENVMQVTCIDTQPSETVEGEWGALVCEFVMDGVKYVQSFGGLSDYLRNASNSELVGNTYTVKYEQFKNGSMIQGFIRSPK